MTAITNKCANMIFESSCPDNSMSKMEKTAPAAKLFIEKYSLEQTQFDSIRLKFKRMVESKPRNDRIAAVNKWQSCIFYELPVICSVSCS